MTINVLNQGLSNSPQKRQGFPLLELSLKAKVICVSEQSGQLTHVIVNPTTLQVSHIVVKRPSLFGYQKHLVPIDYISSTTPQLINLNCTQEELARMPLFCETHYIETEPWERECFPWDEIHYASDTLMSWSYPFYERTMSYMVVEKENLPLGELAVSCEVQVQALDRWIGKLDVLLVERNTRVLSGLVVRSGNFFDPKERLLPTRLIERFEDTRVYLKSEKKALESFPSIPRRRYVSQTRHDYLKNALTLI